MTQILAVLYYLIATPAWKGNYLIVPNLTKEACESIRDGIPSVDKRAEALSKYFPNGGLSITSNEGDFETVECKQQERETKP